MSHPFTDFYHGKRVLISGHTSFAGGWLAAWLKLLGAKVCGYGPPPSTRPNFFDATFLDRGMTSIFGDLRNREALANIFADFQPEIVIHYAAQLSPQQAKLNPVEAFSANTMGTVHILEEARQIDSVRAVVIANTDRCYDDRDPSAHGEDDPLGGRDAYSSSAACVELAASAYIGEFFRDSRTAVATARSGNAIGGGDWTEDELIPKIVHGITTSKQIPVSQGSEAKAWHHVLEPVRAHLLLAQTLFERGQEFSGPWNFGPTQQDVISARDLAESLVKGWGAGKLIFDPDQRPSPADSAFCSNTKKTETYLAWKPLLSLEDAISLTVEWYKLFYANPASAWRITEDQIQRYMKMSAT